MDSQSYTSESQSKRLIELGVPESTCDIWKTSQVGGYRISTNREVNSKPVWSLGKLLHWLEGAFFDDLSQRNAFWIDVDLSNLEVRAMVGMASHKTFNTGNLIDNIICMIEYVNSVCSKKINYAD